jgi:hypothetical protein
MKKLLMCCCTAFVFSVAAAVAQTTTPSDQSAPNAPTTAPNSQTAPSDQTTPSSQGTQSSSPSMQQGATSPDSTQGSMAGNSGMKGEKKMKGCIQSEGGQYVLQTKRGKDVALTGQDVSAHVGHEVTIHGMWEGAGGNMSNTSSGNAAASGKSFSVTGVDMISDTCSSAKGLSKDKAPGSGMSQPQ